MESDEERQRRLEKAREYTRRYRLKPKAVITRKKWRSRSDVRERERAWQAEYRNRPDVKARVVAYRAATLERKHAMGRRRNQLNKIETLTHYSTVSYPCCVRCGNVDIRVLTIDHTNGLGTRERKTVRRANLYNYLRKNGYPDGYQTLCMNCQFIKRWEKREYRQRK